MDTSSSIEDQLSLYETSRRHDSDVWFMNTEDAIMAVDPPPYKIELRLSARNNLSQIGAIPLHSLPPPKGFLEHLHLQEAGIVELTAEPQVYSSWKYLTLRGSHRDSTSFPDLHVFHHLHSLRLDVFSVNSSALSLWVEYLQHCCRSEQSVPVLRVYTDPRIAPTASLYLHLLTGFVRHGVHIQDEADGVFDMKMTDPVVFQLVDHANLSRLMRVYLDSSLASDLFVHIGGSKAYKHGFAALDDVVLTLHGFHRYLDQETGEEEALRVGREFALEQYAEKFKLLMKRIYADPRHYVCMVWRAAALDAVLNEICWNAWLQVLLPRDVPTSGNFDIPVTDRIDMSRPHLQTWQSFPPLRLTVTPRDSLFDGLLARNAWREQWVDRLRSLVFRFGASKWHLRFYRIPVLDVDNFQLVYQPLLHGPFVVFLHLCLSYQSYVTMIPDVGDFDQMRLDGKQPINNTSYAPL